VSSRLVPSRPGVADLLGNLQALTDSDLSRLGMEDLLQELLTRVREILRADTAAVLLLEEGTDYLLATAAAGIEEEVRQGVRVPLGKGFAGTIAAQREPVLLDRVDSTTVTNRILWEKGIRVMLGVPLLAGGRVMGVLHVGRLERRPFTPSDTQLLQIVAERVSGSIQTVRLGVERAAAALLERSLLPGVMPQLPGVEFATRYMTPEDRTVGGDWFDGFVSPSGQLWVVVGDVAGRGLGAAVIMGRIRSASRSYALLDLTPEEVLDLTSAKIGHFEPDVLATAVCAVSDPPYREFRIASAGHPPPVVARPGGRTQILDVPAGAPLGTAPIAKTQSVAITLNDGAVLLLYTDGLIERRDEDLGVGLERLRSLVEPEHPEVVCLSVIQGMFGLSSPPDDVAMVALRRFEE
jgi:sigma-B regulation protein RsbU (phosphoserine phosphatase)